MNEAKQRYDRQIRVWGREAQHRLASSRVLLCGLSQLNVEVAKNLVLAGVNICIQDDRNVMGCDIGVNFFVDESHVGHNMLDAILPALSALNSLCRIEVEKNSIENLADDFFLQFDLISYCGFDEESALRIDNLCRQRKPFASFFWSMAFGHEATFLPDLGPEFQFIPDQTASSGSNQGASTKEACIENFFPISSILASCWIDSKSRLFPLSATFVKSRLICGLRKAFGREILPADVLAAEDWLLKQAEVQGLSVEDLKALLPRESLQELCVQAQCCSIISCSVLGSTLSQEIIKAITCVGKPGRGTFVFSSVDMVVRCIPMPPSS